MYSVRQTWKTQQFKSSNDLNSNSYLKTSSWFLQTYDRPLMSGPVGIWKSQISDVNSHQMVPKDGQTKDKKKKKKKRKKRRADRRTNTQTDRHNFDWSKNILNWKVCLFVCLFRSNGLMKDSQLRPSSSNESSKFVSDRGTRSRRCYKLFSARYLLFSKLIS